MMKPNSQPYSLVIADPDHGPAGCEMPRLAPGRRPALPPAGGYSLVEIVGVLLIIAVLAAAIIPSILTQLDAAARTKEAKDLAALAAGLQSSILRNQLIPDQTGWAAMVADEVANATANVSTNQRRFARAYLINPNLSLVRSGGSGLPYSQTSAGVARPTNAFLMIVGSTRGNLPLTSGTPSAAEFTALWNTPQGQVPATSTWANYVGTGDDLLVQRINLEPLFFRLIFNNPTTNSPPSFNIGTNALTTLSTNVSPWIRYYLDGTVFGLYDTNANLAGREVLQSDTYRVFDGSFWRDSLLQGASASTATAATRTLSDQFINVSGYPTTKWFATPRGQASLYQSFMYSYASWANQNPCFSYGGAGNSGFAPESTLIQSVLSTVAKSGLLVE